MDTLAVIVNHKSADMALEAVRSILNSDAIGTVSVVVVDNSEDEAEAEKLRRRLPSSVRVEVSPQNLGFGRACNRAVKEFRGDGILLINPDAMLLPGCLKRLQRTLFSSRRAGAVSSHLFWDKARCFYLPSAFPPFSPVFQGLLSDASPEAGITRFLSALWRRHSVRVWAADNPLKVGNLSGGLVLLKWEAVKAAGGLFDPRFFLYFEDTDLFLRLKTAGFTLLVDPRAQAVHHYDQCGREDLETKRSIMAQSQKTFLEKNCRGWRRGARRIASRMRWGSRGGPVPSSSVHFANPFVLEVPMPLRDGWLFEVSPNANFIPSAGRFGAGPLMEFPKECWRISAPGRYFGRLGRPYQFGRYAQVVSWVV